jgi:cytochrome c oxidase assembly protein subunit 15
VPVDLTRHDDEPDSDVMSGPATAAAASAPTILIVPLVPPVLRRRPSAQTVHRFAIAALVANIAIVVTGGAVRLTGSGLGCPSWPSCTDESFVPTDQYGVHGFIEFGNRQLTYALGVVIVATLVAAWRQRPRRRDVRALSLALFLGIPTQAVIGGITVLTDLNPWTVMLHFLCSMALVGLATVLVRRTREGDGPPRIVVPALLRWLAIGQLAVLAVALYLGTVVTGSGPHAGDVKAPRTGLDPESVSQLHADVVFLLVGLTVGLVVAFAAARAPRAARRAAVILLALELAQGVVGFVQYFTDLPVVLVGVHMLGASLLVVASVNVVLSTRDRGELPPQPELPSAAQTASANRAGAPSSYLRKR